jgi:hypothetical protein
MAVSAISKIKEEVKSQCSVEIVSIDEPAMTAPINNSSSVKENHDDGRRRILADDALSLYLLCVYASD